MTVAPTRRAVLTGAFRSPDQPVTHDEHISSAVISVLPARREEVIARIGALQNVELHHSSESKLVVVLEGPGSGALGGMLAEISSWPGVLSANMVFEQTIGEGSDDVIAP